ncbi:hypothetical protein BDV95DRAFT_577867 [Massariosphaeria phaeospora]|uniref:Secreted protein n=1 Tax=Massariosphaeria phaeospora TaxID=100035 RepID=A0A7C8M6P4_9PLEO|nr:hypothetical protein BDV95DRAFT_577867 [Massariosphaeria phaeospora]
MRGVSTVQVLFWLGAIWLASLPVASHPLPARGLCVDCRRMATERRCRLAPVAASCCTVHAVKLSIAARRRWTSVRGRAAMTATHGAAHRWIIHLRPRRQVARPPRPIRAGLAAGCRPQHLHYRTSCVVDAVQSRVRAAPSWRAECRSATSRGARARGGPVAG